MSDVETSGTGTGSSPSPSRRNLLRARPVPRGSRQFPAAC